jgi:DNA modification methylase
MGREWDSFAPQDTTARVQRSTGGSVTEDRSTPHGRVSPNRSNRTFKCSHCGGWSGAFSDARRRRQKPCECPQPDYDYTGAPASSLAFQAFCDQWAAECLRVLKPGGHLLAFGGTRTWHRLTCAIEDAGFEIRDTITWLYGSGFPKSLDVGKAIDKQRNEDLEPAAAVARFLVAAMDPKGLTRADINRHFGHSTAGSGAAQQWTTTRTDRVIKPRVPTWEQWLTLRELVGFGDDMDAEVWRLNGRKGTPGEAWAQREVTGRVDEWANRTNYALTSRDGYRRDNPATVDAARWQGWGTALKPASEPVVVARKPLTGTVAANVLAYGTGALNIDACRVAGVPPSVPQPALGVKASGGVYGFGTGEGRNGQMSASTGRWPSNVVLTHPQADDGGDACAAGCVPGCPVADLDTQSVPGRTARGPKFTGTTYNGGDVYDGRIDEDPRQMGDEGGASRYFPTFRYQAKADTAQRPRAGATAHPTVKPLDLMRWIVRLVTPPGGTVLDPFAGSGTTGEACTLEGFRCWLIEREADYLPLIVDRLTRRTDPVAHLTAKARRGEAVDLGLFADLEDGTPA